MSKFRITYRRHGGSAIPAPEDVEALLFVDVGEWIDFFTAADQRRNHLVLRVRAADVERVDRVASS